MNGQITTPLGKEAELTFMSLLEMIQLITLIRSDFVVNQKRFQSGYAIENWVVRKVIGQELGHFHTVLSPAQIQAL